MYWIYPRWKAFFGQGIKTTPYGLDNHPVEVILSSMAVIPPPPCPPIGEIYGAKRI